MVIGRGAWSEVLYPGDHSRGELFRLPNVNELHSVHAVDDLPRRQLHQASTAACWAAHAL